MKKLIYRIALLPLGLISFLYEMAKEGARDIHNKVRFRHSSIEKGCSINETSVIHAHSHLYQGSIVNNSIIYSYSYLGRNCLVQNTEIGKFCSIANDVCMGLGTHPLNYFSTSPLFYRFENPLQINLLKEDLGFEEYKKIIIGNDVWIGERALIMDGITIGHGAVVAANAVVTKDVPAYAIVAGVPAKIIRYRFDEDMRDELLSSEWWNLDLEEIAKEIIANNRFKLALA